MHDPPHSEPRRPDTLRARWRDYRSPVWYFVTICTARRDPRLGRIVDGRSRPSAAGVIVASTWAALEAKHPRVGLDEWIVMPDHFHASVLLRGWFEPGPPGLIGEFKAQTTLRVNRLLGTSGVPLWQKGYHDRILRRARQLHRTRAYVRDNPRAWEERRHRDDAEWMVHPDDPPVVGPDDLLPTPC